MFTCTPLGFLSSNAFVLYPALCRGATLPVVGELAFESSTLTALGRQPLLEITD